MTQAYSFIDVNATLTGPTGVFDLGYGAGTAEEGITITPVGDKNTMTIGADGEYMHSLHADKSGTVTVRVLKTSPVNAKLQLAYNAQTASSLLHGQNIITVSITGTGEQVVCRGVAFKRQPEAVYAKEGQIVEWTFDAGKIDKTQGVF
ncbi:phage structural protein [Bordetella avium]|uniref:phage structural protein n=1 Tax=Bordetella avium TaxID=521 RepID=UPI000E0C8C95|nr:phage protein [Bordetella avium]UOK17556.1 hypothetical protein vBBaMIFTN9_15 [Bordetella phage vB_BaM-IFTN9]RIQ11479.1 DUF3277 family protein [Bordetella avium]RIQ17452.1 DUF3277 family protein [Bordetella avium]RIQ42363.1 DUF3277 family protein [Bordetella avium]RIQ42813.1 DUF3277 family protein [Bordetella avium]